MRNAYKILVEKPEGTRPLKTHRHSSEDTETDLMEIWKEGVGLIHLVQNGDQV
jgi:hypothetical protein